MMDENTIKELTLKVKSLAAARDQLSKGWLQTEREKARLIGSLDYLKFGYILTDDHFNTIHKNPALNEILGKSELGDWTINEIHKKIGGSHDLLGKCQEVMSSRCATFSKGIAIDNKVVDIYLSPVLILKESLACFGVTVVIVDSAQVSLTSGNEADKLLAYFGFTVRGYLSEVEMVSTQGKNLGVSDEKQKMLIIENQLSTLRDISEQVLGSVPVKSLLAIKSFDLSKLVQEVIASQQSAVSAKGIKLEYSHAETGFLSGLGDMNIIKQIMNSLITNAINRTKTGGVKVSIEEVKGFLKVRISDTGEGIKEGAIATLFKKSKKEDGSFSTSLYNSKLLIEEMRGQIFLEKTDIGVGSTFAFTLPVATATSLAQVGSA